MRPGSLIRDYRRANGLSQEELAAKTKVNAPAISRYEMGQRPTVAAAKRLAAVAGFDWTLFFEDVGEDGG
jgi:transcriptional regulator with XRE-family HTH domain